MRLASRDLLQLWIRDELALRKIPYVLVRGTVEERVRGAARVLDRFVKYGSLFEQLLAE